MRTTVTLDRDVERILRETAVRTHKPFKKVLNDTLRDESSPFHAKAAAWCERIMNGTQPVILLPPVIFAFVRISTHPRIFTDPLSVAEASAHVRSWLGRRQVRLHDMLPDDVETALGLLESAGTAGNLTTDAQIAAVALRLDAEGHTADLDFGRFAGVRFKNPLSEN